MTLLTSSLVADRPSAARQSEFVAPRFDAHPEAAYTLGPEVVDLCNLVGYRPDVHQQLLLDRLFAYDENDQLVSSEAGIICARQNLKSSGLKMAALGWLFVDPVELIVWSAHELPTAKEMFRDLRNLILACPQLKSRLKPTRNDGVSEANGNIAIELAPSAECPNGQRIVFKARTLDGGRGLSGDRVVLDEAFALQPDHMAAIMPTLSARDNPQLLYASSAGKASSEVLRAVRDRGRSDAPGALTYLEWCSDKDAEDCGSRDCMHRPGTPGCVLDDRDEWVKANPSLSVWRPMGNGRSVQGLNPKILEMERAAMPAAEFARERLGWWDDPLEGDPVLPGGLWERLTVEGADYQPTVAVDVSPDRSWACIAGAGFDESAGRWVVELTGDDEEYPDYREGVDWVGPRLAEIQSRLPGLTVVLAAGGAAESLVPSLDAQRIKHETVGMRDLNSACGLFVDLANAESDKLAHLGQPVLTQALNSARLKPTEQGFRWARRSSAGDITPLYAATLALWRAKQADLTPEPAFFSWDDIRKWREEHEQG